MKSWLRQHQYAFKVAILRLLTQPFSSLTNMLVVALALCVPFISWALLLSAQPVVQHIPVATEITVYAKPDLDEKQIQLLATHIQNEYDGVIEPLVKIDKNQSFEQLKQDPSWANALQALPYNPLPDAFVLRLSNSTNSAQEAAKIANELQNNTMVDRVQLDRDWLKRLDALLHFARLALVALSLSVGVIVVATVFNTIRLQALNQRQEIAVARLVGATERFVRRPFLYVGAISGGVSSLIAIAISGIVLNPLNNAINRVANSYNTELYLHLPPLGDLIVATLFIMILTACAARWSVTRPSHF